MVPTLTSLLLLSFPLDESLVPSAAPERPLQHAHPSSRPFPPLTVAEIWTERQSAPPPRLTSWELGPHPSSAVSSPISCQVLSLKPGSTSAPACERNPGDSCRGCAWLGNQRLLLEPSPHRRHCHGPGPRTPETPYLSR